MKYRIDREVEDANGSQTLQVEADSLEEAIEKFSNGESEIVDEEVEVTALSPFDGSEIYEHEETISQHRGKPVEENPETEDC